MLNILAVAAGGSLGALARFFLSGFISEATGGMFPWGTLVINVTGSFVLGVLYELFEGAVAPAELRAFLTIGFLGAYTTFSTYSLECITMLKNGELGGFALYFLLNNAGLLTALAGMMLVRLVTGRR